MSQSETPPPDQSPDHRAPLILWRAAQAFLAIVFDLFGAPEQLAARHTLTLKDHQLCAQWLRAAEALMRRMLFIEAALLSSPASGGGDRVAIGGGDASAKLREPRQRQLIGFDADHPEAWRVSFRCFNSSPACGASGSRRSRETKGELDDCAQSGASPSVTRFARDSSPQPKSQGDFGQSKMAGREAAGGSGAVKFRSAWPMAERFEALLRVCNNPAPFAKRLATRLRKTPALVQRLCASSWSQFRDTIGHTLHDVLAKPITHAAAVFRDSS